MHPIDSGTATHRLQNLRSVVSAEYIAAIDYAIELIGQQCLLVERDQVVSMLTTRAGGTDYLVLKRELLDMAHAVSSIQR